MSSALSELTSSDEVLPRRRPTMLGSLRRRLGSGLLSGGGWSFVVATAGVNGFNFLFHVVISRLLGPFHYGALGALLNFIAVLAVPLGAVQLAVTQAVVVRDGQPRSLRRLTLRASICGLGAMVFFWLASPIIGRFLNLGSTTSLLILGAWIPLAVVGAILQGALMGELRFVPVAVATFVGGGALRLLTGVGLVLLGFGLDGAVAATLVGQALTSVTLIVVARRALRWDDRDPVRLSLRDAALSIAALAGYTALTGVDTLLAQHFLPARQAGIYAAAAIAGHIALFLPGALVMVAFPRLASDGGSGRGSRKTFIEALKLVGLLSALAIVGLATCSRLAIQAMFGASYMQSASILGLLALASGVLGLIGLLTYFHIARRSAVSLVSWAGVGGFALVVSLLGGSIDTIAICMTLSSIAVLSALALPTGAALLRSASQDLASSVAPIRLPEVQVDLTLVVPFYNPGGHLAEHVAAAVAALQRERITFEVIAVNDGCTDGSADSLVDMPNVTLVNLDRNQGKGAALRTGLALGRGQYLGFIDGDGDIPASLLGSFLEVTRTESPDIIVGSKLHPESDVVYPMIRRVYSLGYQLLLRILFQLSVRDTQTGVKLIRREVLAAVLPRMLEKNFAFDLELLVVARELSYDNVRELPVRIQRRFTSSISLRSAYRMLLDTGAIFYRLHVLHYYDPTKEHQRERLLESRPVNAVYQGET